MKPGSHLPTAQELTGQVQAAKEQAAKEQAATRPEPVDDARLVRNATGLLRIFNQAGVLGPADVHTAVRVGRICGETDDRVRLAVALTVRALRVGSVCLDLRTVSDTAFDDSERQIDTASLPWPEVESWIEAVRTSPAVADGADAVPGRPLRFAFDQLYLDRYWRQEETVRIELRRRGAIDPPVVEESRLAESLSRMFGTTGLPPGEPDRQRLAAAVSTLSWVTVVAGGPGTGKTTTVAKLLALLHDQQGATTGDQRRPPGDDESARPLRVALAAPTGKAAARLEEAVRAATRQLPESDQQRLPDLSASTLHRLLGWRPDNRSRFRHNAHRHLPYDVIVIDEMSMVSLTLMARLLEAIRPDARLILVGDPDQLSSVEAGAVLADIATAPGEPDPRLSEALDRLGVADAEPVLHGVVPLRHTWRFGGAIDALARAVRASEPDEVLAVLRSGDPALVFVEPDGEAIDPAMLGNLRAELVDSNRAAAVAAANRDAPSALTALDRHRLLCAHRRGPYGVSRWSREAERWLIEAIPGYGLGGEWYLGRPLLVTANDYEMGLYNGDTGVVVETPVGVRAAFARGDEPTLIAPVRLDSVQTVHAMTVHRAQGSQFRTVSFVVPPADSPLLTRELLYTAVTRATAKVQVFGSEEAIRRAVVRPANRASGLRGRLSN